MVGVGWVQQGVNCWLSTKHVAVEHFAELLKRPVPSKLLQTLYMIVIKWKLWCGIIITRWPFLMWKWLAACGCYHPPLFCHSSEETPQSPLPSLFSSITIFKKPFLVEKKSIHFAANCAKPPKVAGDVSKDDPLSHVRGDFQSAMKSEPGSSCQILHLGNFSTFFQKDFCHL